MIKWLKNIKTIFFIIIISNTINFSAQNKPVNGIAYIQSLIENDSLSKAEKELNLQLDYYRAQKNTDSLIKYVVLVGSFKLANNNPNLAIKKSRNFC